MPSSQLPSYVDDVLEYDKAGRFPATGETGKIYIAKDTNKTYRWSGSNYVEITASLALGETSSTAYAGDKGKANAEAIADLKSKVGNTSVATQISEAVSTKANTSDLTSKLRLYATVPSDKSKSMISVLYSFLAYIPAKLSTVEVLPDPPLTPDMVNIFAFLTAILIPLSNYNLIIVIVCFIFCFYLVNSFT